ncbi:MAG: hypothetical protein ABSG41_29460 [Bryobacteraceae bacterium]
MTTVISFRISKCYRLEVPILPDGNECAHAAAQTVAGMIDHAFGPWSEETGIQFQNPKVFPARRER